VFDPAENVAMSDSPSARPRKRTLVLWIGVAGLLAVVGIGALLVRVTRHEPEVTPASVPAVEIGEADTDPATLGARWPLQYDGYKRTAIKTATTYGGHGGSETMPAEKLARDPWLKRMFLGYAFSIDYRDRRGHAYMLADQEVTKRLSVPQSGACLHCHASVMPLYRKLGNGDVFAGLDATWAMTYQDASKLLHESGLAHPIGCVDCHDPASMALRVTRPGFLRGIAALAASNAPVPAFSSIAAWRHAGRRGSYDPNHHATHGEMRSFVCGQCHVEYYCSTRLPLTYPWGQGLSVDAIEAYWDQTKLSDGTPFYDFRHAETGAPVLKAQHPELELWSQGVHARIGVSCADCHMPDISTGATKVSDHWVRSPLLTMQRACLTCHRVTEGELTARVATIQDRTHDQLERGGAAIVSLIDAIVAARARGATAAQLAPALALQRKAQWRLDFIAAENSMGFHAPREAARVLDEALDDARQGELAAHGASTTIDPGKQPRAAR